MANTRFKGGTSSERLNYTSVSDADMIQLRHKPGTEEDTDKGISKASLVSCPFGVSETIAATAAKTAALTDSNPDFSLVSGREVVVYFSTANSANTPTLNFAGSGAAPMYYPDGSAVGSWAAGTWMHLKYFSATVGGVLLQRWILLSPGKVVDEVALNNMHSVTSNAVASHIIVDTFTTEMDVDAQSWKEDIFEHINKTGYSIMDCFLSVTTGGAFVENGAFTGNDLVYRVFNNAQIAQHYIVNLNVLYKKSSN